jgi:hypothetical protein
VLGYTGRRERGGRPTMRTWDDMTTRRRRWMAQVGVAALTLTLFPGAAQGANKDFVNGGFTDHFGENVGVHAESGPSGANPRGHESATRPGDTRYRLTVVCLAVQGNVAAYGTIVLKSNNPDFPPGTEFVEIVRDSGLPGGEGDGWDIFDGGAHSCEDRLAAAAGAQDILSGNIHINDA